MVEYADGSVIAQMAVPDMHLPIEYALLGKERADLSYERLDFRKIRSIDFEEPDTDTFKGLALAFYAGRTGGSMPVVFNAANEAAVRLFVNEKIRFLQIYDIIEEAMTSHEVIEDPDLETVLAVQAQVEEKIREKYSEYR